jgi:hypothetical protein
LPKSKKSCIHLRAALNALDAHGVQIHFNGDVAGGAIVCMKCNCYIPFTSEAVKEKNKPQDFSDMLHERFRLDN